MQGALGIRNLPKTGLISFFLCLIFNSEIDLRHFTKNLQDDLQKLHKKPLESLYNNGSQENFCILVFLQFLRWFTQWLYTVVRQTKFCVNIEFRCLVELGSNSINRYIALWNQAPTNKTHPASANNTHDAPIVCSCVCASTGT